VQGLYFNVDFGASYNIWIFMYMVLLRMQLKHEEIFIQNKVII
jgi:hypothetical protein